jgi:hypothetical protein
MTVFSIPVRQVINGAVEANLTRLVIIGRTQDGELYCAANTAADDHLSDIQAFLLALQDGDYDYEDGEGQG